MVPSKANTVLGLDLGGNTCGWAYGDKEHEAGIWDLSQQEYPHSKMMEFSKLLNAIIFKILDTNRLEMIAYEHPNFNRGQSVIPMLIGVLWLRCGELAFPYFPVSVPQIKRLATGSGRAKKDEMVATAEEKWGYAMTDDEADARWIREWMIDQLKKVGDDDDG